MTVRDLITATLKLIGSISKTEVPSPDELQDAFDRLNDMLDSWQAEKLTIYQTTRTVYNLTAAKGTYTIGLNGSPDFAIARPIWILDAGIINTAVNPTFELPVTQLTIDQYAALTIKSQQSTLSWYLYNDYAYPNSNLTLWPIPSVNTLQLVLYLPAAVAQFTSVDQTISLPPGYSEALRYNLAMRLSVEWGRPADPTVMNIAQTSFARIQRANKRIETVGVDPAIIGSDGLGIFNWISGSSGPTY